MSRSRKTTGSQAMPLVAGFLAWLVPGAGHVYLGRVTRGIVLFVTISAMFWGGVAVGGVMIADPQAERWWFLAQSFTGVHGLIGWQRQKAAHDELSQRARKHPAYNADFDNDFVEDAAAKAKIALVAPSDTVARAYAGVAGLLNLLCIFDAVMLGLIGRVGERDPEAEPSEEDKA